MQQQKMPLSRRATAAPCKPLTSNSIKSSSLHLAHRIAVSVLRALQAALDADGKPAWLQGLMGNEGGADLLQEQADASSEEEEVR